MANLGEKHDKVLSRVHLWIAVVGGAVTLAIGLHNFKHLFFPAKAESRPVVEARSSSPASGGGLSFNSFRSMDQNGDGKVSANEWRGRQDFALLDLDGNGALNPQDFTSFETMDLNGDGAVARTEWRKTRKAFQLLDADGDGSVSAEEFSIRDKV